MPFYDRLDITIPWIFYNVPHSNPGGPDTVFTDRFWDDKENWFPPGVGVVPFSLKPYFGPIPPATVGPVIGTVDQWQNGFSYSDYIASGGSPLTPCITLNPGAQKPKMRATELVTVDTATRCIQLVTGCPGELVPCQLSYIVKVGIVTVQQGKLIYQRSLQEWTTAGQTPPDPGPHLIVVRAQPVATTVLLDGGSTQLLALACGPFSLQARGLTGPIPSRPVITITYPT